MKKNLRYFLVSAFMPKIKLCFAMNFKKYSLNFDHFRLKAKGKPKFIAVQFSALQVHVHWIHLQRLISTLFTLANAPCIKSRHRDAIMLIEIHSLIWNVLAESGHSFTVLAGRSKMYCENVCCINFRSVITFWSVPFIATRCNKSGFWTVVTYLFINAIHAVCEVR